MAAIVSFSAVVRDESHCIVGGEEFPVFFDEFCKDMHELQCHRCAEEVKGQYL